MSSTTTSSRNKNIINYSYRKGILNNNNKPFLYKSTSMKNIPNTSSYKKSPNSYTQKKMHQQTTTSLSNKQKTRNLSSTYNAIMNNPTTATNNIITNETSSTPLHLHSSHLAHNTTTSIPSFSLSYTRNFCLNSTKHENRQNTNRLKDSSYISANAKMKANSFFIGKVSNKSNNKCVSRSFLEISEEINQSNASPNIMNMNYYINRTNAKYGNHNGCNFSSRKDRNRSVISLKRKKINLNNSGINTTFINFSNINPQFIINKTMQNKNEMRVKKALNLSDEVISAKKEVISNNLSVMISNHNQHNNNNNNLSERHNNITVNTCVSNLNNVSVGNNNITEGPEEYHFLFVKILQKQKGEMIIMTDKLGIKDDNVDVNYLE